MRQSFPPSPPCRPYSCPSARIAIEDSFHVHEHIERIQTIRRHLKKNVITRESSKASLRNGIFT